MASMALIDTVHYLSIVHDTLVPAGRTLTSHSAALLATLNRRFARVGCTFEMEGLEGSGRRDIYVTIRLTTHHSNPKDDDMLIGNTVLVLQSFIDGYHEALR